MSRPEVCHISEPTLAFRYGQQLEYSRDGLYLYGPVDAGNTPRQIRYGFIGTKAGLERFERWAKQVSSFIPTPPHRRGAKEIEPHHVPFPGFSEAFNAIWSAKPSQVIADIDEQDLHRRMHITNRHEAIKSVVDVFVERLVAEQKRNEDPPSFWYVVVPEFIYELGRPMSTVPKAERVDGKVTLKERDALKLATQPTLFGFAEEEAEVYKYEKNFRRQLKARLLEHQVVTQIVRESTLAPNDFLNAKGEPKRRVEDTATIAWKLCSGSYYKSGGRPWQIANMRPGVCYVGLVYKRQDQAGTSRHSVCAAQMFLSDGEGVVFRGALGPWFHPDTKQFHLDKEAAMRLVGIVLNEYKARHGTEPKELFIHAKSSFSDDEWDGFKQACQGTITNVVGVQIADAWDQLKLFRSGAYALYIKAMARRGVKLMPTSIGSCTKNFATSTDDRPPPCYGDYQCDPDCQSHVITERCARALVARKEHALVEAEKESEGDYKSIWLSLADKLDGHIKKLALEVAHV